MTSSKYKTSSSEAFISLHNFERNSIFCIKSDGVLHLMDPQATLSWSSWHFLPRCDVNDVSCWSGILFQLLIHIYLGLGLLLTVWRKSLIAFQYHIHKNWPKWKLTFPLNAFYCPLSDIFYWKYFLLTNIWGC